MQRSIFCSLLLSFPRAWCPLFCSTFGSMFVLWPNANILKMRLDTHPSCCAGYCQITAMAMCCFVTGSLLWSKSAQCLINWYFSILPCKFSLQVMLCHICFWDTFFPSTQPDKNAVVKGRRLQENWVFSGSSVWMKRSCMCLPRCCWTGAPMFTKRKIEGFFPSAERYEELWDLHFRDHIKPDG